jgi:hypothetical protein
MTVAWPKATARMLTELTGEPRPDVAIIIVLRDAVEHRLEQITAALNHFESKYGMSFAEYKNRWETKDDPKDYSLEAESDYLEWEALVTRKARLESLRPWLA